MTPETQCCEQLVLISMAPVQPDRASKSVLAEPRAFPSLFSCPWRCSILCMLVRNHVELLFSSFPSHLAGDRGDPHTCLPPPLDQGMSPLLDQDKDPARLCRTPTATSRQGKQRRRQRRRLRAVFSQRFFCWYGTRWSNWQTSALLLPAAGACQGLSRGMR